MGWIEVEKWDLKEIDGTERVVALWLLAFIAVGYNGPDELPFGSLWIQELMKIHSQNPKLSKYKFQSFPCWRYAQRPILSLYGQLSEGREAAVKSWMSFLMGTSSLPTKRMNAILPRGRRNSKWKLKRTFNSFGKTLTKMPQNNIWGQFFGYQQGRNFLIPSNLFVSELIRDPRSVLLACFTILLAQLYFLPTWYVALS